jgi:iron(III) transport system substrate-binding protein
MPPFDGHKPTRRTLLTAAAALASPIGGLSARNAFAQAPARAPTKVLDFLTYADVAKAEQEGAFVFYCHENEAGTAAIAEAFGKDFPKIKTSYVRAQTGALYNKISTERAAGRFDVDILQLSDLAPALDFQKKGGYAVYHSPEAGGYKPEYLSNPAGSFFWTGVTFGGLAYSTAKVRPEEAPKSWKDLLDPKWRNAMSCKISSSGLQFVQWYELRKLYGDEYWQAFAKQRPRGFDSRVQLFDRLAKGDDKVCALAEYAAYVLYKEKGAAIEFVAPEDGLPATPLLVGIVDKAPHPEVAKLFVDWAMSNRGQAFYQSNPNLIYGSLRTDAPPMPTGKRLSDFKLLTPTDYADYLESRDKFTKDWNGMLGL